MKKALLALGAMTLFGIVAIWAIGGGEKQHGTPRDLAGLARDGGSGPVAAQMIGKIVQDQQGQGLGRVVALMSRKGSIAYILMSKMDARDWIPIPIAAAYLDHQRNAVVLRDLDLPQMAKAPAVSPDDLQVLDDPQFESEVHSYYGNDSGLIPGRRESKKP